MIPRKCFNSVTPSMLILLLIPGFLHAQEPPRSLSIQEAIGQLADNNLILESARTRIVSLD